jgi:hypothetical protein
MKDADLLEALCSLAKILNSSLAPNHPSSLLDKYNYFINNSTHGRDCQYAIKAKEMFLKYDYEEVKKMFLIVLDEYRKVEGVKFGR